MTPEIQIPNRARVSIIERLIPGIAFGVAAIGGALGGVLIIQFLETLRRAETAGYDSFFIGTARIELAMGSLLGISAGLGLMGLLVAIVRMFTENKKASPPGFLFLVVGAMSLIPPFIIHYILYKLEHTATEQVERGISSAAQTVYVLCYVSIALSVIVTIALLTVTFVPFTSRLGRKFSPAVFLAVIEILMIALAGIFFWQSRQALGHTSVGLFP